MTLLSSLAAAVILILSGFLLAGAGKGALALLRISFDGALDSLLFSLTLGAIALELVVSLGELVPNVRYGVLVATAAIALLGVAATASVLRDLRVLWQNFLGLKKFEHALAVALFVVLALEGLASLAPITGSDALHYHFTAQAYYLQYGFHANWSLLPGFFCGLGHQLILVGLAFRSDKLAAGLLSMGGIAGALAILRLTRQFIDGSWPYAAALAFALTPVPFWQITAAGAPDIWMCALLPLAVLSVLLAARTQTRRACALAGILAGACAGTKYTGITMAGALLLALAVEIRSAQKCFVFFGSAVAVGSAPYLRNLTWTGDPVFPFLFARRHVVTGNLNALAALLKDTGASNQHGFSRMIRFPLFAITDYGFATWQFFGPLVLALAPVALLSLRKTPLWRTVLTVWLIVSFSVGKTSGTPRFLMPILPLALAASIGGVALLTREHFRALRFVTVATLAAFCAAGFAALLVYAAPAWSVVIGRVSPSEYLRVHAQDFERCQFVNTQIEQLAGKDRSARALIFFRHLYYVRIPFVDGDPDTNWEMYPRALQTKEAWLDLFRRNRIQWIVRAPNYPLEFAEQLTRLQNEGVLKPCASGTVQNIFGYRMNGQLVEEPITILCVAP